MTLATVAAVAQYSLHDFYGDVSISRAGKPLTPEKGMKLNATDMFSIGDNSGVEILNPISSQIFKSSAKGDFTTTRIMIDAKAQATDNRAAIHDKIRFGRHSDNSDNRVYVEKGLVRRSMEVYDPEADNLQVDIDKLSVSVVNSLRNFDSINSSEFPVTLLHAPSDNNGLKFMLENTLNFPVYFNVLKFDRKLNKIEISELGQPTGNYVVLRDQTIVRSQASGLNPDEQHLLIMTHCFFDIDELLEHIETQLKDGTVTATDTHLPVYIRVL